MFYKTIKSILNYIRIGIKFTFNTCDIIYKIYMIWYNFPLILILKLYKKIFEFKHFEKVILFRIFKMKRDN